MNILIKIKHFVINNFKELILFATVSIIYIICTTPDLTWIAVDCDLWDFMIATKFGMAPHFPGFPVWAMIGTVTQMFYAEGNAWILALVGSTIPAILTVVMVFYITRKLTENKWAPYVAALGLAGANCYFSQAIIPEVYTFSIFSVVLAWFLIVHKKYSLGAIATGLAIGGHPFVFPAILAMFIANSGLRKKWYLIIPATIIPYLYIVFIATRDGGSVIIPEGSGWAGFLQIYVWGIISDNFRYWGSIALWNFPKRLYEMAVLLSCSFGLALIPMFYYLKNWRKAGFIIGCIAIPVFYYIGCNVEVTYVHFAIAFPFLAVTAGLGMDKIKFPPVLIVIVSAILLVILPLNFDVGNTIDKNFSARDMYEQIKQIPDGSAVFNYCENTKGERSVGGREQRGIIYYNKLENKHIIPVNLDFFIRRDVEIAGKTISSWNDKILKEQGLNVPEMVITEKDKSKLTTEETRKLCIENMEHLVKANPDREFYFTKNINDEVGENYEFGRRLVKWSDR